MDTTDLLDRPQAAGELTSGIFRDPLFSHTLKDGADGLSVVSKTTLSGVSGQKTVSVTPVANTTEAQAFVNGFDRALLSYGRERGVGSYTFRHDAATDQAILVGRNIDPRAKEIPADQTYSISSHPTDVYGKPNSQQTVISGDGTPVHENGSAFVTVGQMAARAGRDHLAHRAEAKMGQDNGGTPRLPFDHAKSVLTDFVKREATGSGRDYGTNMGAQTAKSDVTTARFNMGYSHVLEMTADPAKPEDAGWVMKTPKLPREMTAEERKAGGTHYKEVDRGPLTMESLTKVMAERSSAVANKLDYPV